MGFRIESLGTATPPLGIAQQDASEIAQSICCQTEAQGRILAALYRRAGVRRRYSVAIDSEGVGSETPPDPGPLAGGGSAESVCLAEDRVTVRRVAQSFYPPAVGSDDRGPTTAERMEMYERHSVDLAAEAATQSLDRSTVSAADISHLITVTCTGFNAPGIDLSIIRRCGLNPSVARTQIGFMGCHGAINGLKVARSIAESDPRARVMLCAVELCTLHQHYGWYPEQVVSNALFADGAAALIGYGGEANDHRGGGAPTVVAGGSTIVPDTADLMSWRVRDHGFEMNLSARVPSTIEATLHDWIASWLDESGLGIEDVRGWAIHPGGPKILRACARALGLGADQMRPSFEVLSEFGNMSSPTVLFIFERLMRSQHSLPCVMLAFGPGLSIEAALIR